MPPRHNHSADISVQGHIAIGSKAFRFFDLPRELRDAIYGVLPVIHGTSVCNQNHYFKNGLRLHPEDRPLSRFILINKHFGDEYSQRATKADHLHFEDQRIEKTQSVPLPAMVINASQIPSKLASCAITNNDEDHMVFIKDVLRRMNGTPSFHLKRFFDTLKGGDWLAERVLKRYEASLAGVEGLRGFGSGRSVHVQGEDMVVGNGIARRHALGELYRCRRMGDLVN